MKQLKLTNPDYQKLEDGFKTWLETMGHCESSVYGFPLHVREFLHYLEQQNKGLNQLQINDFKPFIEYFSSRKNQRRAGALSGNYINKMVFVLDLLRDFLNKVYDLDLYCKITRQKADTKPINIFTTDQIKILYEACDNTAFGIRNRAILSLCYGCGLRKSEAVALECDDFWWEKALLQVRKSKTKKSRLVPMTEPIMRDFKDYLNRARYLFLGNESNDSFLLNVRGNPLSKQSLYMNFVSLLKSAELPKTGLHSLRHSIASHLAMSGMPSEQIAEFLGHQTLDSTQIYVHFK